MIGASRPPRSRPESRRAGSTSRRAEGLLNCPQLLCHHRRPGWVSLPAALSGQGNAALQRWVIRASGCSFRRSIAKGPTTDELADPSSYEFVIRVEKRSRTERSPVCLGGATQRIPRPTSLGSAVLDASASVGRRNDCAFRARMRRNSPTEPAQVTTISRRLLAGCYRKITSRKTIHGCMLCAE